MQKSGLIFCLLLYALIAVKAAPGSRGRRGSSDADSKRAWGRISKRSYSHYYGEDNTLLNCQEILGGDEEADDDDKFVRRRRTSLPFWKWLADKRWPGSEGDGEYMEYVTLRCAKPAPPKPRYVRNSSSYRQELEPVRL